MPFKSVHLECTRGPHLPFPVSLNVPRLLFQLVWRGPCYCSPQGRYLLHLGSWLDHHLHGTAVRAFSPSHTAPRGPLPPPPPLSFSEHSGPATEALLHQPLSWTFHCACHVCTEAVLGFVQALVCDIRRSQSYKPAQAAPQSDRNQAHFRS